MAFKNIIQNRREFLRSSGRNVILLGMVIIFGKLLLRKPSAGLQNQKCANNGICAGCRTYSKCELPQALSAKKAKGE